MTPAEQIILAESGWVRTAERRPSMYVVVETMGFGGFRSHMTCGLRGRWHFVGSAAPEPGYTPQFWRPKP